MQWTQLLQQRVEDVYGVAERLIDQVDEGQLDWKPATGDNWMTTGQLLEHMTTACGRCSKGFVTGDWGMPEGQTPGDMPPEDMLPTAERMSSASNLADVRKKLAADRQLAVEMIQQAGEEALGGKELAAPWNPAATKLLGYHMLDMVEHLNQHKGQLFYYLKLQEKPVNTMNLWW